MEHKPFERSLETVKASGAFTTSEANADWLDNLGCDFVDFQVDITDAGSNTTITFYADCDDGDGNGAQIMEEDGTVGGAITRWFRTYAAAVARITIRISTRGVRTRLVVKGDNASGAYAVHAMRVWR